MRGNLLWTKLKGTGSIRSTAAVNKAASLNVSQCSELTQASIWPYFMITINAGIAYIKMWSGDECLRFH